MNCPNCGEEIRTDLYDDTAGAVFITWDSNNSYPFLWPASMGLKKYKGCVNFGRGVDTIPARKTGDGKVLWFSIAMYKDIYYACPKEGEAWLVKPHKDGYEWERVDEQIGFSVAE